MSDGERGQIILIAAFTLAVTFVALALVINSAIFTENLASRGETSGSSEALYYQHQVRDAVGDSITYANVHNHSDLPVGTGLSDTVEDGVEAFAVQGSAQQAVGGGVVDAEFDGTTDGTRLASNASGGSTFLSASDSTDWKLAEHVQGTRNFVIEVSDTGELHDGSAAAAFRVELNNTGAPDKDWNVSIRRTGALPYEVVVETQTPGGTVGDCRVAVSSPSEEALSVDVTGAVVGDEHCPALERLVPGGDSMSWATGMASYNVSFEHGDRIEGNYSLVVRPRGVQESGNFDAFPTDPYATEAVYSARVRYVYRTANVAYDAFLEVAPGDPDD